MTGQSDSSSSLARRDEDPGDCLGEENFRFRFVSRGENANRLTLLAVRALLWCHPRVSITIVDANDEPQLTPQDFPGADLFHIVPGEDAVAAKVGRGSRKHIFYWRHSPEVFSALPLNKRFSVYMDSDIILMRPMDLSSVDGPLRRGRICASVDESTLAFWGLMQKRSAGLSSLLMPLGGGGPLLQAGLIFSNGADDGGLYKEFWRLAEAAAAEDVLDLLPFDDMALLSVLLTRGGKLWERWLPLGHEWNFITATDKEPGAFVVGAHYGGFRAKALVLDEASRFTAPDGPLDAWGSTPSGMSGADRSFSRGVVSGTREDAYVRHRLVSPFAISWRVPSGTGMETIQARAKQGAAGPLLLYVDGSFRGRIGMTDTDHLRHEIQLHRGRVVTVIAPSGADSDGCEMDLHRRFFP